MENEIYIANGLADTLDRLPEDKRERVAGMIDSLAGEGWKKFALDYCRKDLAKRTKDDGMPADLEDSELPKQVADGANWSWGKDKASVTFWIFMLSGMPSENYPVDIPYKLLKPYMKPDAPVL